MRGRRSPAERRNREPHATAGGTTGSALPRWLVRAAGFCVAFLVFALTLWVVLTTLFAVPLLVYSGLVAVLLAALLQPLVSMLDQRGIPRWLAAFVSILLVLATLLLTGILIARRAMAQLNGLSVSLDTGLTELQQRLTSPPLNLSEDLVRNVSDTVVGFVSGVVPTTSQAATTAIQVVTGAAIVLFVLFFLLKDGPGMWQWVLRWCAVGRRHRVDRVGDSVWRTMRSYVRGMVLVALIDAVAIGAGLFLLDVPLALSLTVIVFLGAFVPIVGATVSGALAVLVTAGAQGVWQASVVLAIVLVVQQVEGNLLHPLIMGQAVDLHPVVILLAVAAGGLVAGIGGAIIAVPLLAAGYTVVNQLLGPSSHERPEHSPSTEP